MRRSGLSEPLIVVLLIATVVALAVVFYAFSYYSLTSTLSSTYISQAQTLLLNVAYDLSGALANPSIGNSITYPIPNTLINMLEVVPGYCNLTINGINYPSYAVLIGVPPNTISMPIGFRESLIGINLTVANETPIFNVVLMGSNTIRGIAFGEYLALYPRLTLYGSQGNYLIIYPRFNATYTSSLTNLLVFNVTSIKVISINDADITYTCGYGPQTFSWGVSDINGEIEIITIVIHYG